ncbi:MAG TPA: hypothetical protein VL285_14160 [Bryobacteraceae bacterium]|jgi:hypothetical protein|nr:hypothetical protein [Bryobacteraceae bacterium]
MQFTKSVPPERAQLAFFTGLPNFLEGIEAIDDLGDILTGLPPEYDPLEIHTLGLQDLAGAAGIAAAEHAGWRFMAGGALTQPIAGDVTVPPFNRPPKLISLMHGPQVPEFLHIAYSLMSRLEAQPNRLDTYELRILSVPGLLVEAFWLKTPDVETDLVVPYRNLVSELEGKPVFTMTEFLSIVKPLAAERLQFDD